MSTFGYISFLTAPLIAVIILVYMSSKQRGVKVASLIMAFIWGMISVIFLILAQLLASYLGLDELRSLRRIIFYSVVVMAFFSETGKFMALRLHYYRKDTFRNPVDGILYSVLIAMGFTTMQSILLLIRIDTFPVPGLMIATAAPANLVFGVLMGFFLGLGKLRKLRFIDSMTGLSSAVVFHALYMFCLFTNDWKLLTAFFIGSAIIILSLAVTGVRISMEGRIDEKRP